MKLQIDGVENVLELGNHVVDALRDVTGGAGLQLFLQVADGVFQLVDFVVLLGDETVKDVAVLQIVQVLVYDRFELAVTKVLREEVEPLLDVLLRHLLLAGVVQDVLAVLLLVDVVARLVLLRQEVVELLVVVEQPPVFSYLPLALRFGLLQTLVQQVELQAELFALLVVGRRFFVEFVQTAANL